MTAIPTPRSRVEAHSEPINALVLIIDDEPAVRRDLTRALADRGARTVDAASGAEGLSVAAQRRPDLVILDLGLPDISGDVVCRELRSWSTAPIVALSGRHSEAERVRLLDLGADDILAKPFGSMELVARVRAHLRRVGMSSVDGSSIVHAAWRVSSRTAWRSA